MQGLFGTLSVTSINQTIPVIRPVATLPEVTAWAFVAIAPALVAAWFGIRYKPGKKLIGMFLALSSGLLISTISFELVQEAAQESGVNTAIVGFLIGVAAYLGINTLIDYMGVIRRTSSNCGGLGKLTQEQRSQRNISLSLVVGSLLDGIPESIGIGVSFLENGLVPAAIIGAAAISNIPEGLASGVGLKKSHVKTSTILLIWSTVVLVCVASAAISFATMHNASDQMKSGIMAFAGGGALAMTLESVVPEAYAETQHWVSILGSAGFAISFYLDNIIS